jgi:hypothetical protein
VIEVSVELREELGAEVNVYCTVGVPPLQVAAVAIGDSEPDAAEIEDPADPGDRRPAGPEDRDPRE